MFIGIGIIITTATRVVWVFAYHFSKVGFRLELYLEYTLQIASQSDCVVSARFLHCLSLFMIQLTAFFSPGSLP